MFACQTRIASRVRFVRPMALLTRTDPGSQRGALHAREGERPFDARRPRARACAVGPHRRGRHPRDLPARWLRPRGRAQRRLADDRALLRRPAGAPAAHRASRTAPGTLGTADPGRCLPALGRRIRADQRQPGVRRRAVPGAGRGLQRRVVPAPGDLPAHRRAPPPPVSGRLPRRGRRVGRDHHGDVAGAGHAGGAQLRPLGARPARRCALPADQPRPGRGGRGAGPAA